jgi:WD40 repeat protein
LTEAEEAFASAMTSLATRRRRRRRAAAAAAFVVLLAVLVIVGGLWQQSVAETRRAEAAHLVSLGQLEPGTKPSETVAYAIASLEQADSRTARMLALKALWKGPTALIAGEEGVWTARFGHDGSYLVQADISRARRPEGLLSIVHADGTRVRPDNPHCEMVCLFLTEVSETGHIVSFNDCEDGNWEFVLWSMPEGIPLGAVRYVWRLATAEDKERHRHVMAGLKDGHASVDALGHDGTVKHLGTLDFQFPTAREWRQNLRLDAENGHWLAVAVDNEVRIIEIGDDHLSEPRYLFRADNGITPLRASGQWLAALVDDEIEVFDIRAGRPTEPRYVVRVSDDASGFAFDPEMRFVATLHPEGEIRLWSLTETASPVVLKGPQGAYRDFFLEDGGSRLDAYAGDEKGWDVRLWSLSGPTPRFLRDFEIDFNVKWLVTSGRHSAAFGMDPRVLVWSMDAPVDAEPLVLVGAAGEVQRMSFSPGGEWLATVGGPGGGPLRVWPLAKRYPSVIRRHDQPITDVEFAPDGSWLASASADGTVKLWPLVGDPPPPGRTLLALKSEQNFMKCTFLAASPDGSRILAGTNRDGPWLLRTDGEAPSHLGGFNDSVNGVAFSADGRLAAAAGGEGALTERVIRVWDVESEKEVSVLDLGEQPWPDNIAFTQDGHLLSSSESGLLRWNVETGDREVLYKGGKFRWFSTSADGHRVILVEGTQEADDWGRGVLLDLDSGTVTRLDRFGDDMRNPSLDATGTLVVNGNGDGEIMIGRADGSEPHLLVGHEGSANFVAIDPLGRWIASGGSDKTVRLWPMPNLDKPPLHTLPREELIAKLKTLTNLRVVRDEESPTGWKLTVGPFPGWAEVPTW